MIQLIFYSLIGGLFSLGGGLLLLLVTNAERSKKIIVSLLGFAAGAFLGAIFLHILPEALEMGVEPHYVMIATLVGFLSFFVLERLLMIVRSRHHGHEHAHIHSDHTESLPFLLILGDIVHNFMDGIIIALAYIANPVLGLTTTLAVAAHEIPQEIGDFSILLDQGWSKRRVIIVNILQSLVAIPGVIVGFYLGSSLEGFLPYMLSATAGAFLYIAASDLIPELHHRTGHKHFFRVVIPLVASVLLVGFLIELSH